jgi:hypothetical protein
MLSQVMVSLPIRNQNESKIPNSSNIKLEKSNHCRKYNEYCTTEHSRPGLGKLNTDHGQNPGHCHCLQIKFYWNTTMITCLHNTYSCFHTTTATDHTICKAWSIYYLSPYSKYLLTPANLQSKISSYARMTVILWKKSPKYLNLFWYHSFHKREGGKEGERERKRKGGWGESNILFMASEGNE